MHERQERISIMTGRAQRERERASDPGLPCEVLHYTGSLVWRGDRMTLRDNKGAGKQAQASRSAQDNRDARDNATGQATCHKREGDGVTWTMRSRGGVGSTTAVMVCYLEAVHLSFATHRASFL